MCYLLNLKYNSESTRSFFLWIINPKNQVTLCSENRPSIHPNIKSRMITGYKNGTQHPWPIEGIVQVEMQICYFNVTTTVACFN